MSQDKTTFEMTQAQHDEFVRMVREKVHLIIDALQGEHPPFVVLEALLQVHRMTVNQLPDEFKGPCATAVAAYAGELLQTDIATRPPGTPVH